MSKENIAKKLIAEEKGFTDKNPKQTTTFLIKNWGFINMEEKILLEQISKFKYIYNIKGKKGVENLKILCESCGSFIEVNKDDENFKCSCGRKLTRETQGIYVNKYFFKLESKPQEPIYLIPDEEKVKEMLSDVRKIPTTKQLFNEIDNCFKTLFEFQNKADSKLCAISVLFSYLLHHFSATYHLGIDATKGSGKTTLLEILSILTRHGFLADVSPASIPRLKHKFDLNIFIDEIDALNNGEDVIGMLRKGQRRGNKYIRCNKTTLDVEIFDAFGFYAYSFRSNIEDAFKDRSFLIRTTKANDSRLSVINLLKEELLHPLFDKIFMWYMENIFVFSANQSKINIEFLGEHNKTRDEIYKRATKKFTAEENELINQLFGRNSEVAFLVIEISKFIGIDLFKEIKGLMMSKVEEEETEDNYYYDLIKEIFENDIKDNPNWLLKKGEFAGYRYFPKMDFYYKLVEKLKNKGLMIIGTPKFTGLLKDVGFITGYNIRNQRVGEFPKMSLIFDIGVLKHLKVEYSPQVITETLKI